MKAVTLLLLFLFILGCSEQNFYDSDELIRSFPVELPIDTDREAIEYSKSIQEFIYLIPFKNESGWSASAEYILAEELAQSYEEMDDAGYLDYVKRLREVGDYWEVSWAKGKGDIFFCRIGFKGDSTLTDLYTSYREDGTLKKGKCDVLWKG